MGPPGWKTKFAGVGLGLQKFAAAKKSTYDKRAVQAKEQALNAKKVNKYRKLLKKLGGAENGESTHVAAGEGAIAAEGSQTHRIAKAVRGEVRFEDAPSSADKAKGSGKQPTSSRKRKQHQQREDDRIDSNSDDEGPSTSAAAPGEAPRHDKRQKGKDGKQGGNKLERPKTSLERLAAKVAAEKEAQQKERKKADEEWAKEMAAKAAKQKSRKKTKSNYMKKTKSGQPVMKHRVDKILSQLQGGDTK